jgi:hypothetical protein
MIPRNKKPTQAQRPQPPAKRPAGSVPQFKPAAAQPRGGAAAPPPARPPFPASHSTPQTVQQKKALVAQPRTPPAAPPVYRPQPLPRVLQTKTATPRPGGGTPRAEAGRPAAPPAYRPQPPPKVLQAKLATAPPPAHVAARRPPPAAVPTPRRVTGVMQRLASPARGVIQPLSNFSIAVWGSHAGSIALGSGSDTTVVATAAITTNINAVVTEKDLNHFCNGHTIAEFSFDTSNIDRCARTSFWPAATSRDDVKNLAVAVLGSLKTEIIEAVGLEDTINIKDHMYGGVKYVITITTVPNKAGAQDADGNWLSGTARLEQFYPVGGTGILWADKSDLHSWKATLGK